MDLRRFHAAFIEEASEHIEIVENGLMQLEKAPDDAELLNSIFRSAHTIKGSSGTVGLPDISRFTHIMEEILESMRAGELRPAREMISTLLEALDMIKEMVAAVASEEQFPFERCHDLMSRMNALRGLSPADVSVEQAPVAVVAGGSRNRFLIRFTPPQNLFQCGMDPVKFFDELQEMGEISELTCETEHVPRLSELNYEELYLRWTFRLTTDRGEQAIREVFEFIEDDSEISVTPLPESDQDIPLLGKLLVDEGVVDAEDVREALTQQKKLGEILVEQGKTSSAKVNGVLDKQAARQADSFKKAVSTSIRVDLKKLDHLVNLVGEMVIIHSMFHQVMYGQAGQEDELRGNNAERIDTIFSQLQRIGKDIQEGAMALRMLPVGEVFQRFTRLVRELSSSKGKDIELIISGEETELDKGVLEKIADPLVHLIRNSVDHGIEPPDERAAAGKPRQATVYLMAYQMGDAVYIDVKDDGRGLDKEKIIAKALEKGVIQTAVGLSDDDAHNLIMLPGFSTADRITDISGRGVGMDVVKKNIEALNGTVQIRTRKGVGTTISIRLPLTLAIIDGLTVGIGEEVYIIPITSVIESLRPDRKDVNSVSEQGTVVNVRGECIPLIRLHRLLDISCRKTDPREGIVVVTQHDNNKYGFLVDELLGEQQIVLKNLGSATPKVRDIAGGTIMGDGRVALVLDVVGIVAAAQQQLPVRGSEK
ncbi:chemotaxis protein CheA [Geobacter sp. SVR]|uniref:chemotaxis protein CheA n=1 Tax=Geobacter sp. SVR TaxID=2495594 RepID=UPI00143EFF34|nr:chemotaxis protein CheA [Geobacter sp. SVR]BCS52675.1 chemotaxis protein CheA [Geobacter sp. SVR]GCF86830.1 chemotaxis protein CheA [Geobacter sp. SVR]